MNTFAGLITLGIMFTIVATLNNLIQAVESQKANINESFLTYNNTAYGISIQYPSNWQIDESGNEFLLAILQNLSSYSQGANDDQNNALKSKASEILDEFGVESVSDLLGLNPDNKAEILQKISQMVNEGTYQTVVSIMAPSEDEFDTTVENMIIAADNISSICPISLHDYTNANIEGIKKMFQDFKIVQSPREVTIDGRSAMTFVYTMRHPVVESVILEISNVHMINGNTAYVLTYGYVTETYSEYESTFEKMLQSFKINN